MVLKERRQKEREIAVGATALCSLAGPLPKLTLTVAGTTSLIQRPLRICSFWGGDELESAMGG